MLPLKYQMGKLNLFFKYKHIDERCVINCFYRKHGNKYIFAEYINKITIPKNALQTVH